MTPIEAARSLTFNGKTNTLLITTVCPGGTPEAHSKRSATIEDRLNGALDIYSQMGIILSRINEEKILFPDAKNSNWLLDAQGKLVLSDTKALVFSDDDGYHDAIKMHEKNKWIYGSTACLITTDYYSPPEINDKRFNVDQMHSFILGKNLYQYLTQCRDVYLSKKNDASSLNFNLPVFKTTEGQKIEALIRKMVVNEPSQRISVEDAIKEINRIKAFGVVSETVNESVNQDVTKPIAVDNSQPVEMEVSLPIDETKASCIKILSEIQNDSNLEDRSMITFIGETQSKIKNATSEELETIASNLKEIKNQNQITNKFLDATLNQIQNSKWKYGGDRKLNAIRQAVYDIPVEERGKMMDNSTSSPLSKEIKRLHAALGTWRTILGNFAPLSPSSSTIYKKYKTRYDEIKKEQATSTDTEKNVSNQASFRKST